MGHLLQQSNRPRRLEPRRRRLASGTPPDTTPLIALLQSLNLTTAGGPGHEFTVTYTDNTAVDTAGIDDLDLLVLGPNAYSNDCVRTGLNELSAGTPRVATYSCAAPPGGWDAADNGTYQVFLRENQVFDTAIRPARACSGPSRFPSPPPSSSPLPPARRRAAL